MSLIVSCSKCRKKYKVGDDKAGKKIKCSGCGAIIAIPAAAAEDVDPWDLPPAEDPYDSPPPALPRRTVGRQSTSKPSKPLKKRTGSEAPTWLKVLVISFMVIQGVTLLSCGGCYLVLDRAVTSRREQTPQQGGQELPAAVSAPTDGRTLAETRASFQTRLTRRDTSQGTVPEPPADVFRMVRFNTPGGQLAAYLSPDPKDGKKHPAIVWITGGDCNTIGDVWSPKEESNDQTAAAYRQAGIIMMFPSMRGGDGNPGVKEGFLGEVDDILAATDFLSKESYIDPSRIYLGGHSTGGTMVLLVAEMSNRYRAVFSFGPVDRVEGYGGDFLPIDLSSSKELQVRSPLFWLAQVKNPTFVFEGTDGNIEQLKNLSKASTNPQLHFHEASWASHFTILAPMNRLIAQKILRDDGPTCNVSFSAEELSKPFSK